MTAPLLILAVGNPSRGDDAAGPLLLGRAEALLEGEIRAGKVEVLTDFQLQVEHALDLEGRREVVFVDASVSCAEPYEFRPVHAEADASFTTHALSPSAVLHAFERTLGRAPPECFTLAIRGEQFSLGEAMSASAEGNLEQALDFLVARVRRG
jgi:hydrogenase maturation protease